MTAAITTPPASPPLRSVRRIDAEVATDRWLRLGALLALWANLLLVTYWWDAGGGFNDLRRGWAAALTSLGRLSGLWSADLLLMQVLLMSRLPWLEQAFGRDRLSRIHRIIGFLSFDLMLAHIIAIIGGYAGAQWSKLLPTTWSLLVDDGGILLAAAGTLCLVLVVVSSIKAARRRLHYESWHLLHLYAYLGVGLALPHQLWTGQEFLQSTAATVYWWTLWVAAAGAMLTWRVVWPLWRSLRHGLRVTSVQRESADVVSVYLAGRRLERLRVRAGQFINVRFLTGPGWTRANPFSLSAAPDGRSLRITAKALGEGSARLADLKRGTRAIFEGPYGRLSSRARSRRGVVLAGAGVGITPLRALAEGMAYAPGEVLLIHRYTSDPLFRREFDMLAAERGLGVLRLAGRRRHAGSVLGPAAGSDELTALRSWIPDLAERDVYLCGPTTWTTGFANLAAAAGVPRDRIHTENFGW